jgi:uncharacterized membrane protein
MKVGQLGSQMNRRKWILLSLIGWLLIGAILRFTNLEAKPPWSDEWATLVFSLGHSFRTVPLDQVISLDTLLEPLQLDNTPIGAVSDRLLTESTHPPLYFLLTHFWLKLFSVKSGLVSIGAGRSLSVCLGLVAIPAMFAMGWLLSRSLLVAQLSAALMAISPYGIYLSQEARHYTLVTLWVIASLACLIITLNKIKAKISPSIGLICVWIIVNGLGIATHYFFALTLVAETLVLFSFWLEDLVKQKKNIFAAYWFRVYMAMVGTFITCSVWIPIWLKVRDNELTDWVFDGNPLLEFYEPLQRLLVWVLTMVFLLPVEGVPDWLSIISGVIALIFLIWLVPSLIRGYQAGRQLSVIGLNIDILTRFLISAIALILSITYIFSADLTLSARFQFIYFPVFLLWFGIILSCIWQESDSNSPWFKVQGRKVIYITLLIGILGALTVINNFAYQKVERPDLVVPVIAEAHNQFSSKTPVVLSTLHKTHGQTGEMMSIAWEWQRLFNQGKLDFKPQFLLAHQETQDKFQAEKILYKTIQEINSLFQLWLVNFSTSSKIEEQKCSTEEGFKYKATGYRYSLYICQES